MEGRDGDAGTMEKRMGDGGGGGSMEEGVDEAGGGLKFGPILCNNHFGHRGDSSVLLEGLGAQAMQIAGVLLREGRMRSMGSDGSS